MASINQTDLKSMREEYKEIMKSCCSQEAFSFVPLSRKNVVNIRNMIRTRENLPSSKLTLYNTYVKDNYYLDTNERLTKSVRLRCIALRLPVLPWEDAFDVIWKAHVESGHGTVTDTLTILKPNYYIEFVCVYNVVKICYICKKKTCNAIFKPIYNNKRLLEIIDMSSMPDGDYNYLCIYTDEGTGLVQLRAFKDMKSVDLALKLINIFTDFGPPKILVVYNMVVISEAIIDIVNPVFEPCEIELEMGHRCNSRADTFKNMILEWMKEENSQHWEIGCYVLQKRINNSATVRNNSVTQVFEAVGSSENDTGSIHTDNVNDESMQNVGKSHFTNIPPALLQTTTQANLLNEPEIQSDVASPSHSMTNSSEANDYDYSIIDEFNIEQEMDIGPTIVSKRPNLVKVSEEGRINKNALNTKQNVPIEYVTNDSKPTHQDNPSSSNINNGQLTFSYPDSTSKCSVCNYEITSETYVCIKCMNAIHYECGASVIGSAIDDPLVCFSCEKHFKHQLKT